MHEDPSNPSAGPWPIIALRYGLDLLVVALLVVAAGRAVVDEAGNAAAVVVASAVEGGLYLVGSALARRRASTENGVPWLAALCLAWLVLMALTPDATWVAFPLFLLQLYLLPQRWALAAVALTTLVAIGGFVAHQDTLTLPAVVGPMFGAAITVVGALGYRSLYRESERRRELIDELHAARGELAEAGHAAGVAAERERLAREIHDTLAQGLTSIQLLLRAGQRELPQRDDTARAAAHIEQARLAAHDNLAEARRFVRALSPPGLDEGSLEVALDRLCSATAAQSDVEVEFHLSGDPVELAQPYERALLRVAQSALANTVQHADARRATVTLSYMDTGLALDIVDDGRGFDPTAALPNDAHFGLSTMRARVLALGGSLSVEYADGTGTALAVSFDHPPTVQEVGT